MFTFYVFSAICIVSNVMLICFTEYICSTSVCPGILQRFFFSISRGFVRKASLKREMLSHAVRIVKNMKENVQVGQYWAE